MNKQRRDALTKCLSDLEDVKGRLEELKDEEQEYFDNMPESFQQGDKGQTAEAAVSALEEACSDLDNVTTAIESAME